MVQNVSITLNQVSPAQVIEVNPLNIIMIVPKGTGSIVTMRGDVNNTYQVNVTQNPAAIKVLANA